MPSFFFLLATLAPVALAQAVDTPPVPEPTYQLARGVVAPRCIAKHPLDVDEKFVPATARPNVEIEFTVTSAGTVEQIRVLSPVGPEIAQAAISTLKRWRFDPATAKRRPVAVTARLTLQTHALRTPHITFQAKPRYTQAARMASYEGRAVVAFAIGKDGAPRDIRVITPLEHGLTEAAVAAVEKWRYEPAMRDGVLIEVRAKAEVNFVLGPQPEGSDEFSQLDEQSRELVITLQKLAFSKNDTECQNAAKAVEERAGNGDAYAQLTLFGLYNQGLKCVAKNPEAAQRMWTLALKTNEPTVMVRIGQMMQSGKAVRQDTAAGARMFRAAAAKGNTNAMYFLSKALLAGVGVTRDESEAARVMLQSARLRMPQAAADYGEMCREGRGVKADPVAAYAWFLVAEREGIISAVSARTELAAKLTPAQIDQAIKLSMELIKSE